jgi:hypothetical protein
LRGSSWAVKACIDFIKKGREIAKSLKMVGFGT